MFNNDRPESDRVDVESFDNHIYFYDIVTASSCLAVIQELRAIDSRLINQGLSRMLPEKFPRIPIWLHINSCGGDLFSGLALANQIKLIVSPVYSIVEGICASAATFVSLSCTQRYVLPDSYMLVHQFSSGLWGKHDEFQDEMIFQRDMMETLVNFYAKHTRLKKKALRRMMKRDYWMSSTVAVEMGFADSIIGGGEK